MCVCVNPHVRPWQGRTRDWDTTQRMRVVLQLDKTRIFPRSSARQASWFTAAVARWCCKSVLDPRSAASGIKMRERGELQKNLQSQVTDGDYKCGTRGKRTFKMLWRRIEYFMLQIGGLEERSSPLISGKNVPTRHTAPVSFICSSPTFF